MKRTKQKDSETIMERGKAIPCCDRRFRNTMTGTERWIRLQNAAMQGDGSAEEPPISSIRKEGLIRTVDDLGRGCAFFSGINRLVIVASGEEAGELAACYAIGRRKEFIREMEEYEFATMGGDEDDDPEYDYDDIEYDDDDFGELTDTYDRSYDREISLWTSEDHSGMNPYAQVFDPVNESEYVVVTGIRDTADLERKFEAIRGCGASFMVIVVNDSVMEHPAMRYYAQERTHCSCRVEVPDLSYYAGVLDYLCEGLRIRLPERKECLRIISALRRLFGRNFDEALLLRRCRAAAENAERDGREVMHIGDFLGEYAEKDSLDQMFRMTGLREAKQSLIEFVATAEESLRNPVLKDLHGNMIFYGNPGSGKTTFARIASGILTENGVSNGVFVEADRSSLIGKFVGQTAPKIRNAFEEARGGVLFVDEAGFFLQKESDCYIAEAVKEFVRFMENCPDVTVIFAMYEHEYREFLKLDKGLSSRITRYVHFEDYTSGEMEQITLDILSGKGYRITGSGRRRISEYLEANAGRLANGRGARLFAEAMICEHSMSSYMKKKNEEDLLPVISVAEINRSIERMKKRAENERQAKAQIGFVRNKPEQGRTQAAGG